LGALTAVALGGTPLKDVPGVLRTFFVLHMAYGWGYCEGIWRLVLMRRAPSAAFKSLTR